MWTTFALVAALSCAPAESGTLALTNPRSTFGILGPTRPDNKVLPGDQFVLSFDMEGIQADDQGKVLYSVAMEVTDGAGKVRFKQAPRDLEAVNSLGGNSLPAFARLQVGLDHPPGEYKVKVTVVDRAAKTSQTLTSSYEVLPKAFGLVQLTLSADADGQAPAPVVGVGESLFVNFAAVGFARDNAAGNPNLGVVLTVKDEDGKAVGARPLTGEVGKDAPAKVLGMPMQFGLHLNRAGKFIIEVKATDRISRKEATLSFPLSVLKPK